MSAEVTIILSSAGRRGALVRALREGAGQVGLPLRIVATDCSAMSAAGHLSDSLHLVPRADSQGFIDEMVELAEREGTDTIVPTIDTELAALAENRKRFLDIGCDVEVSDLETIEICSDKERSSRWLAAAGFPVPRQYDWPEVVELPPESWPLFFKPRDGSSSIGAQPIASLTELGAATQRHGHGVTEELVPGDEYTVDCWVDRTGDCKAAVPRRRIAVRAGEVSKSVTVRWAELEQLAASICETLPGARGPITIQAIAGERGIHIIEINPRFGGGFPLSHEAGALYTAALIARVAGLPADPGWFDWRPGLTMLRYDDAVFLPSPSDDGELR